MQTKAAENNSQPLQHTAHSTDLCKGNSIRRETLLASTGSIGAIADHRRDAISDQAGIGYLRVPSEQIEAGTKAAEL